MSGKIVIRTDDLKGLSNRLTLTNRNVMNAIRIRIDRIKTSNENLISKRISRERKLCDQVFGVVESAGVSSALSCFPSSYDLIEAGTRERNAFANLPNDRPPASITDAVIATLHGHGNSSNTRVFVNGVRNGDGGVGRTYNNIISRNTSVESEAISRNTGIVGFLVSSRTMMSEARTTGDASDSLISIINKIGDEAIDSFLGVGGVRDGKDDGFIKATDNVADVLRLNIDTCDAAIDELGHQGKAFARTRAATDAAAAQAIAAGTAMVEIEDIPRSTVRQVIYLPELLSDNTGLVRVREEQINYRYDNLKKKATDLLYPFAEFLADGYRFADMCQAYRDEIKRWNDIMDLPIEISRLQTRTESNSDGHTWTVNYWGSRVSIGRIRDIIPSSLRSSIQTMDGILSQLIAGFENSVSVGNQLKASINNGSHVTGIRSFVENEMYDTNDFADVQSNAQHISTQLAGFANVINNIRNTLQLHMHGPTVMAFGNELASKARFVQTVQELTAAHFGDGGDVAALEQKLSNVAEVRTRTAFDSQVAKLIRNLFDEDGNLDFIAFAIDLLLPSLNNGEFTDVEWAAILSVFGDARVSPYEITATIQLLLTEPALGDGQLGNRTMLAGTMLSWGDGLRSFENQDRIEMLWNADNFALIHQWPNNQAIMEMVRRLALEFNDTASELAMAYIWGYPQPSDVEVFESIRHAQLFLFLGSLESHQLRSGRFDFSALGQGKLIDFNAEGYLNDNPHDSNIPGYIMFNGQRFFMSGWLSFALGNFSGEYGSFQGHRWSEDERNAIPDGWDVFLEGTSLLLTLFPKKGGGTAGDMIRNVRNVRSLNSTLNSAQNFTSTLLDFLNREELNAIIDRELLVWQLANMSSDLGGAVIYTQTPSGAVLNSLHTQTSMINYSFLDSRYQATGGEERQFSPDVRNDRLSNAQFRSTHFGSDSMNRNAFREDLSNNLRDNFDSIPQELRDRYEHVTSTTSLDNLPEAFLQYLLNRYFD